MTTLKAQPRESGKAKDARRAGLLPAVLYGRKEVSTPISIEMRAFEKALNEAGESTVVTLEGIGAPKDVLIHEISYDAVSGAPVHVDLYAIEKGQTVTVSVPLEFEGVSPAVKDLAGILVKVMHELEVEGEPRNMPHSITVDISKLTGLDSQIHVQDLALPAGVVATADPEEVVASISVAQEEEESPAMDISQIEVEKKGKTEEEPAATEE